MNFVYYNIYFAFILVSVILFIIGFFTTGQNSFSAFVTGFSIIALAIILILVQIFIIIFKNNPNPDFYTFIKIVLNNTGPFIVLLSIIGFLLFIIISNKDKIINNNVSSDFYIFNNISIILLLVQIYIVYSNIKEINANNTNNTNNINYLTKLSKYLIYLIGLLNFISSIILFVILKYYTTDGFTTLQHSL